MPTLPRLSYSEYSATPGVRWSVLKEMRRSPKHYQYRLLHPLPETPYMRLGRAVHTAVLEPDLLDTEVVVFAGKVRRGKEWDAFEAEHAERTILKRPEYEMCCAIRDAVRAHPLAKHLLEVGEAEKAIAWTDQATGLPIKGRVDWLNSTLCDLKTDSQLSPRRFGATAARYGYHCQLALYRQGLRALGWDGPVQIMAVETEPPYDVGVFLLDDDTLYAGEEEIRELLSRVAECEASGQWPGMMPDEVRLELPAWSFPAEDEGDPAMGLVVGNEEGA